MFGSSKLASKLLVFGLNAEHTCPQFTLNTLIISNKIYLRNKYSESVESGWVYTLLTDWNAIFVLRLSPQEYYAENESKFKAYQHLYLLHIQHEHIHRKHFCYFLSDLLMKDWRYILFMKRRNFFGIHCINYAFK